MVHRPASVASRGSTLSKYHTVARTSQVDESLFGSGKPAPTCTSTCRKDVATFDHSEGTKMPEIVAVTKTHLDKMMGASPILSTAEAQEVKKQAQVAKDKDREAARARKARMHAMDEERKKQIPLSETEQLKQQADTTTLTHAEKLLAEQQDEVKAMNQMMLYSKCVTIRDAQLEERKHMMLEAEAESRRLDMMMEVERLKALENYEERERQRKAERLIGAAVLQDQLQMRQQKRADEEEARARERTVMLKETERLKEEELRGRVEKQLKAQQLIAEVGAANDEQVQRKKATQEREVEEEARIAQYNRVKALREEAAAEERARVAAEKELEVARLRAAQEKAADRQSELDELRARRHAEGAEREWRAREAAKAARNKAILEDLTESRQAQQAAKVTQQASMALHEKADFERILRANQEKEAQEATLAAQAGELRKQHQSELLAQIAAREEERKLAAAQHQHAGRTQRQGAAASLARLEAIKQAKLAELRDSGVPAKYCAELAKYKVGNSSH